MRFTMTKFNLFLHTQKVINTSLYLNTCLLNMPFVTGQLVFAEAVHMVLDMLYCMRSKTKLFYPKLHTVIYRGFRVTGIISATTYIQMTFKLYKP